MAKRVFTETLLTPAGRRGLRTLSGVAGRFGLLLMLGGCSVGPDFERPKVAVSNAWSNAGDPRIAAKTATDRLWWKAFEDPVVDQLVEVAYRQNLSLQIAGLRIAEARARLGIATGNQYPQHQEAFANANAVGLGEGLSEALNVDRNFGYYQVGFDAAWELDFWGKYRRGVEAEQAGVLASMADYYSAIVSITAEVARTYVVIRTFEVQLELAEQNAKLQEEGLEIANSRFRNGATSELDPTQATTLLESTRATIPQLRTGLQQARNALSTLLGQPPGAVEAMLAGPKAIPKAPTKVAVGVPADMLRRRPDIRRAELAAAAQSARIGIAKADLYPSFSLVGTVGLQAATVGPGSANPFSSDGLFYTVGPQVHWAFFQYGRVTNAVRVEDARFQQLLVAYHDTVLKAAQEVEDALSGFLNAQVAVAFEQKAVAAALRSVELSVVSYREGATDYQRVLDAQRSLLDEQNALAKSSSQIATNLIALYKALGGGWELRQGAPIVTDLAGRQMKDRTDWGDMLEPLPAPEPTKTPAKGKQ